MSLETKNITNELKKHKKQREMVVLIVFHDWGLLKH